MFSVWINGVSGRFFAMVILIMKNIYFMIHRSSLLGKRLSNGELRFFFITNNTVFYILRVFRLSLALRRSFSKSKSKNEKTK